jgi:hypothetical protein
MQKHAVYPSKALYSITPSGTHLRKNCSTPPPFPSLKPPRKINSTPLSPRPSSPLSPKPTPHDRFRSLRTESPAAGPRASVIVAAAQAGSDIYTGGARPHHEPYTGGAVSNEQLIEVGRCKLNSA